MARLSSKSRRRMQMLMTREPNAREIAISNHLSGLFKKARELYTLCSVETALVVFFPGGKALSFGYPGANTVMNRLPYLSKEDLKAMQRTEAEATYQASVRALKKKYSDVKEKLEAEKCWGEKLKQLRMESPSQDSSLVERPIDELNLEELFTLKSMMEEFEVKLKNRLWELSLVPAASIPRLAGESDASLGGSTDGNSSADPWDHDVGHEN